MLHKADNPWMPSFKLQIPADADQEILAKERLRRCVQSILNKLTPQNFTTLLHQFNSLNINTVEKLKIASDLTYEKAINEPLYSTPYANLSKHLAMVKAPVGNNKCINFCDLILMRCQSEFEKDGSNEIKLDEIQRSLIEAAPDRKKQLEQAMYEREKTTKYRKVGNIRFMGELFKLDMLNDLIIHECIQKLLGNGNEEALECLCKLFHTAGKKLDEGKLENSKENIDLYFAEIQRIADQHVTSTRIRFMLQDIIDLKKNNWMPRRKELSPTTIAEIHKEFELETSQANETSPIEEHGLSIELKLSGPDLEENYAEKKCRSLIEEFLSVNNLNVTLRSIAEAFSSKTINVFLETSIHIVLEESSNCRASVGQLLFTLLNEKLITSKQYKNGFGFVFLHINKYEKGKPQIWKYLAEIITPVAIHDAYGINYLKNLFHSCLTSENVEKLMTSIRQCTNKKDG